MKQQKEKTLQSVTSQIVDQSKELLLSIREYEAMAALIEGFDSGGKKTTTYWVDKDGRMAEQSLLEAIGAFEETYEREGGKL